jgi:Skp family chaperone for outer membrane proteins
MKKIIILSFSFLFFCFFASKSYSSEKIVFINFEYVINNSNYGKTIFEELNKIRNENIEKLKLKEKILKDQESEIKTKKNVISKEDLNKKIKLLNANIKEFQNLKKSMDSDLDKIRRKKMKDFMDQINPLLEKYMDENSVDIMLDTKNMLIGKKTINKSDDILKLINKDIK